MPNLEMRIARLETARGTGLAALTDDELDARIRAMSNRIEGADVLTDGDLKARIAQLRRSLAAGEAEQAAEPVEALLAATLADGRFPAFA